MAIIPEEPQIYLRHQNISSAPNDAETLATEASIGPGDDLAPTGQQAITLANAVPE